MGKIFLEHMGGKIHYDCSGCGANITNRDQLISTRFTGPHGRAYLFGKVVNVTFGEVQDREMSTGRHKVREVFCKNCSLTLGWIYEFAVEESERYKEGKTLLDRGLIKEVKGLDKEI